MKLITKTLTLDMTQTNSIEVQSANLTIAPMSSLNTAKV